MSHSSVLNSVPGRVSDQLLQHLRRSAHAMRNRALNPLEAETLLHHMPDLLDELQELRTATGRDNVVSFLVLPDLTDGAA